MAHRAFVVERVGPNAVDATDGIDQRLHGSGRVGCRSIGGCESGHRAAGRGCRVARRAKKFHLTRPLGASHRLGAWQRDCGSGRSRPRADSAAKRSWSTSGGASCPLRGGHPPGIACTPRPCSAHWPSSGALAAWASASRRSSISSPSAAPGPPAFTSAPCWNRRRRISNGSWTNCTAFCACGLQMRRVS